MRYQLIPVTHDIHQVQRQMNELAEQGWEYVDTVKRTQGMQYIIFEVDEAILSEELRTKMHLVDPESYRTQADYDTVKITNFKKMDPDFPTPV